MSFRAKVLKRSCLTVVILTLIASKAVFGQAANSPVAFSPEDAITTTFVTAPNLASSAGGNGTPAANNNWLKVEVHFGTTTKLITPYLDSLDVKIWVEGLDPEAKNSAGTKGVGVVFTGTVTYVNVAAAKDVYGVMYIHPSTLSRYSQNGYNDYDRKFNVHAELLVGGAVMDAINKTKEQDPLGWFKPLTVIPNLVYRQDQTPFTIADPDRYPAVKLPAPAQ